MSRIRQYYPDFYSGFKREERSFNSVEELVAIPWVAQWTDSPAFHRFSLADDKLMAETHEGYHWWVVGFINGAVDLPPWVPRRDATDGA